MENCWATLAIFIYATIMALGEKGPQIKCLFTYNIMKVNRTSVFLKTQENHDFLGKWAKHSRMPPSTAPPVVVRRCSPTWMMSCGALHCLQGCVFFITMGHSWQET